METELTAAELSWVRATLAAGHRRLGITEGVPTILPNDHGHEDLTRFVLAHPLQMTVLAQAGDSNQAVQVWLGEQIRVALIQQGRAVSLTADGAGLTITPSDDLDPAWLALARLHKPAIVAHLRAIAPTPPEVGPTLAQVRETQAAILAFLEREGPSTLYTVALRLETTWLRAKASLERLVQQGVVVALGTQADVQWGLPGQVVPEKVASPRKAAPDKQKQGTAAGKRADHARAMMERTLVEGRAVFGTTQVPGGKGRGR